MKKVVMAGMVAVLLAGCAVKDGAMRGLQAIPLTAFQPSESNPNQRIYKEPGTDLRQYNQVLLDPLQFIRQENGQWFLLTTSEQSEIGRYYHDKFQAGLVRHGVRIATDPGPGVLRIQAAITNFDLTRPDPKLLDLLPAKVAVNVTRQMIGKEPYLLRVNSMAQLLDSQSGKLLVRVMDARDNTDTTYRDTPISFNEMQALIDQWVEIRTRQLAPVGDR